VAAYTVAIGALTNVGRRETLMRFRTDHERHVADLTRVIRRLGGTPVDRAAGAPGPFAAALTDRGAGGDAVVMRAFKAHEGRVCEAYTRAATHAAAWPEDAAEAAAAGADDEALHYEWVADQIDTLGGPTETPATPVTRAAEVVQSRLASVRARLPERIVPRIPSRLAQRLPARPSNRAIAVGAIAVGVGFLLTAAIGTSLRRRR